MINSHSGRAGYHPVLKECHLAELLVEKKVKDLDGLRVNDKAAATVIIKEATATSCEEYLVCLFL